MQDLLGKAIPATLTALCLMLQNAWAELPKRDLTVELRQVKDGEAGPGTSPRWRLCGGHGQPVRRRTTTHHRICPLCEACCGLEIKYKASHQHPRP
jgi:hypothetical protein